MPIEKTTRAAVKKAKYNRIVKSAAKTALGIARNTLRAGNNEESNIAVTNAVSALHKASKRKVIHRNYAARAQSRLNKRLSLLGQDSIASK